jgi:hypothetical protein
LKGNLKEAARFASISSDSEFRPWGCWVAKQKERGQKRGGE